MIRLPCYEPAGRVLELSPDDLTRHVIAFGSTGSGKTTALINPVLRQLLAWRANEPGLRPGLLVLDPKGDDSAAKVREFAREAGRESDLVVLSAGGNAWFDLLGGLERLDQIEFYASRLLAGTRDLGKENAYWTESRDGLVHTALTLMLANGSRVRFAEVVSFMQEWWFTPDSRQMDPAVEFVKQLLCEGMLRPLSQRRLELALAEVKNWRNLDPRTKETHRGTLHNALRPLLSSVAHAFFAPKPVEFRPRSVLDGKILVVSLDAVSHPDLARLIFRIVRQDFYAAVQSRKVVRPDQDRLCGLVADELALSVMPADVQALSVIRAKGGIVVAAAQSVNGLDEVLGWRGREALLANFNSVFFFAARESALDEYAMLTLGTTERRHRQTITSDQGDVLVRGQSESLIREPVCAPGTLSRLQQHQAFAKLADGTCTESPVWLQPMFFDSAPTTQSQVPDDLSQAVSKLRERQALGAGPVAGATSFLLHMHRRGHRLLTAPAIVTAAWPLCMPRMSRNEILSRFDQRIAGMENLPSCWLVGLYHWLLRHAPLASIIVRVEVKAGVLWPTLDRSAALWGDGPTAVPENINLFIYPSMWRPLLPPHRAQLLTERPDLGNEIGSPSNPMGSEH